MKINDLVLEVKYLLDSKGFAYDRSTFWEKATLAHTEISELADVIKKKGYEAQEEIEAEVADIIIRTINFALMFDFDLENAIRNKMNKNWDRPFRYNTTQEEGERVDQ
jgi:NTP pyrophosphatase (non-canonical NTP hydrolase)